MNETKQIRALYSFPHKLGANRICTTAWYQVSGLLHTGLDMIIFPGVLHKQLPSDVEVRPTLSWRKLRISYKLFGTISACALHDYIVSRRIEKMADKIDIIHAWPLGARRTLRTAAKLGITTVLERPSAHTRFAYEVIQRECERLGVTLPHGHEYAYNEEVLRIEEEEFELADRLLCPSDFVLRTFLEKGFPLEKLARHQYGFDEKVFYPDNKSRDKNRGLTMLFVGLCGVVKGLHYALEAWLQSTANREGTFLIVGEFLPAYYEKISHLLSHPSIHVLGYRYDVPELMRRSDILVLPSIQEGFPLVCAEAVGSGCVPLVSEACAEVCKYMENALVHPIGDVKTLTQHITLLHKDRTLLDNLRTASLRTAHEFTWTAAGLRLAEVYRETIPI